MEFLITDIKRKGWDDPAAIQLVLDETPVPKTAEGALSLQELLALSSQLEPEMHARVLAACGPGDMGFLFSMLESDYARQAQAALAQVPVLPDRTAETVLSAARNRLTSSRG